MVVSCAPVKMDEGTGVAPGDPGSDWQAGVRGEQFQPIWSRAKLYFGDRARLRGKYGWVEDVDYRKSGWLGFSLERHLFVRYRYEFQGQRLTLRQGLAGKDYLGQGDQPGAVFIRQRENPHPLAAGENPAHWEIRWRALPGDRFLSRPGDFWPDWGSLPVALRDLVEKGGEITRNSEGIIFYLIGYGPRKSDSSPPWEKHPPDRGPGFYLLIGGLSAKHPGSGTGKLVGWPVVRVQYGDGRPPFRALRHISWFGWQPIPPKEAGDPGSGRALPWPRRQWIEAVNRAGPLVEQYIAYDVRRERFFTAAP